MTCPDPELENSIDWELMLKAVRYHTSCPLVLLYIERWLKASVQLEDGSAVLRTSGTPQGGVVSPVLANLFLHYAFDMWMKRTDPHCLLIDRSSIWFKPPHSMR